MTLREYENTKNSTTQRELEALYSSEAFKAMKNAKGNDRQNWNWQTEELEARKSREQVNRSEIIVCPGSSQNGIEVLDSSFSEAHSVDHGQAPMEV